MGRLALDKLLYEDLVVDTIRGISASATRRQPYSTVAEMVEQLDCTPAEKEMLYHGNAEGLMGIS